MSSRVSRVSPAHLRRHVATALNSFISQKFIYMKTDKRSRHNNVCIWIRYTSPTKCWVQMDNKQKKKSKAFGDCFMNYSKSTLQHYSFVWRIFGVGWERVSVKWRRLRYVIYATHLHVFDVNLFQNSFS